MCYSVGKDAINKQKDAIIMPRQCYATGKRTSAGNNVSHSNRRTKRTFKPNLQKKTIVIEKGKKTIRKEVYLSMRALRTMTKNPDKFPFRLWSKGEKP
jgi:large subunit ribosomal protein L28